MAYNNCYNSGYRRAAPYVSPEIKCAPENECENQQVTMCYVPWQKWGAVYDLHEGFTIGTIFPCLNKPLTGRGIKK